jgi:hypothetical protein
MHHFPWSRQSFWRALVALALLSTRVLAQDFTDYRQTTLDATFQKWDDVTKADGPGVSYAAPEKLRFVATLRSFPAPCSNAPLEMALRLAGFESVLQQVSVTHCVTLASTTGRTVVAFVQDVLVPGLKADTKLDGPVEIYAVLFAYTVQADRSRNYPIMMVGRFKPQ